MSQPNLKEKVESAILLLSRSSSLLFPLLIFFLPIQLGLHFWPNFTFVFGIRVDYFSPTIYFTDVLVVLLFLIWIPTNKENLIEGLKIRNFFSTQSIFIYLLFYLLFNALFVAENQGAALYKLIKIVEFVWLAFFVARFPYSTKWKHFLSWSILGVATIGLLQVALQHSIGGVLWYLGERQITPYAPGISTMSIGEIELLRPYSIFSHPNSLAGYMLAGTILLFPWKRLVEKITLAFACLIILLSWSQSVWLTLPGLLFYYLLKKLQKREILLLVTVLIISFSILPLILSLYYQSESLVLRKELIGVSGKMFTYSPVFGIGLNNFIVKATELSTPHATWLLQPVHNIYLLMLTETGLIGTLLLFVFLKKIPPILAGRAPFFALMTILLTGSLDHYWLTLQQNQLLVAFVCGLVLAKPKS